MNNNSRQKVFLIASPFIVLLITRLGIEICTRIFSSNISWIPSFIGYYLAIALVVFIAVKVFKLPFGEIFNFSFRPKPKLFALIVGVILPAFLPISAFIMQIQDVPTIFVIYIVIFACINPFFEETFWRGLLRHLPFNKINTMFYSAVLFSFSHLFFWSFWFKIPLVIVPTVIATFLMGLCWMWFMKKNRNLSYLILSHVVVDILNLSVAVYVGIIPKHF